MCGVVVMCIFRVESLCKIRPKMKRVAILHQALVNQSIGQDLYVRTVHLMGIMAYATELENQAARSKHVATR